MKISPTTAAESRGALLLIGMVAGFAILFLTFAYIYFLTKWYYINLVVFIAEFQQWCALIVMVLLIFYATCWQNELNHRQILYKQELFHGCWIAKPFVCYKFVQFWIKLVHILCGTFHIHHITLAQFWIHGGVWLSGNALAAINKLLYARCSL